VNRGFCFTLTDVADIEVKLIMHIAILLKVGALVFGNNPGDITSTFPVSPERTVICTGAHSFQSISVVSQQSAQVECCAMSDPGILVEAKMPKSHVLSFSVSIGMI
jgi:hypothetical protein